MVKRKHSIEQIIGKLRETEVELAQGRRWGLNLTVPCNGSGADRIVGAIRFRSAPRRCGLCCHAMTPGHGGIRLQGDRNCELAFVNLLR